MPAVTDLPLRAIHLPEAISWWPPALGWWLVLAAALLLIVAVSMLLKRYLEPSLKKEAVKALDSIVKTFHETEDHARCLTELSSLLRRSMLSRKDALKIGGLTGEAWLELLDQPLGKPEFSLGAGRILLKGPYAPQVERKEVEELLQLCSQWVKTL